MKWRRSAVLALIAFVAISVAAPFHHHLTEKAGADCSICHVVQSPADTPAVVGHSVALVVGRGAPAVVENVAQALSISPASPRGPPGL